MILKIITSSLCLLFIVEADPQFFDFFGFPPVVHSPKHSLDYTTRRTKIDTIKTIDGLDSQITWKNTTITFFYDGLEREDTKMKEKLRKQTTVLAPPIFNINFLTTTPKTVRKTTKVAATTSKKNNNNSENNNKDSSRIRIKNNNVNKRIQLSYMGQNVNSKNINEDSRTENLSNDNNVQLSYDVSVKDIDLAKNRRNEPFSRVNNPGYSFTQSYEVTTKAYDYNHKVNGNANYNTAKNPYANNPGVRPALVEKGPPITNRPAITERPSPVTNRPGRPVTNKPTRTTVKSYIVNPIPTDAGALVFPHEDEPPEIIRGLDEDYMSEVEKRRYIEIAEKTCDKYKSLYTKKIQAIPLLPSPDPVQVNVSQCSPTTIPLVVGGKVVTINEFPHMALLGWIKLEGPGYSWKCGGSLISDQYILTAAHCSYQERDNTVVSGPPRVAQLGSSYLDDPGALVVRVAAVVRHPKYKFPKSYYDVALLKLVQRISFSEVIKPACLGVPPAVGEPIIATGWGRTELGGEQSVELRSVSLPVWNMARCHELLGISRKMPDGPSSDSQMCAGEERGGKDTCQGDSGGPAQIQDGCTWRIVAVTSLGRSCGAPNTPGLYALVHRAFISAQVFGNQRNNRDSDSNSNNDNNYYDNQNNNNNRKSTTEKYNNQNYDGYNHNGNSNNDNNNYYDNQNNNNRKSTTEKYNNQNYDGYNHNRRTTTTETYVNQGNYREPSGFTNNNNRKTDNSNYNINTNNNNNNRRATTTTTETYVNQGNYRAPIGFTNNNNNNRNSYYNINTNNNRRTDSNSNNPQRHDYSSSNPPFLNNDNTNNDRNNNNYDSPNNREIVYGSNLDRRESDSRVNNGDYYSNNNNDRYYSGSSDNNRRNDRHEEGTVWFT